MNTTTYRYQLWESVTKHLLPCLNESRQWQALLVEPPFRLPPSCAVQYHSGQPLSALQSSSSQSGVGLTHAWPETKVHSTNTTVLCYVVAGEIDLRIGVTEQIAAQLPKHASHSDYAVISIPKHTFFAIPPGVPYGQGLQGHWERRIRPQLGTSIFWIHFLAPGVLCHQSWYTEEGYVSKGSYYLPDAHLLPAVNALMDEQRRREKSSQHIIHLLLSFIGHSMDRNLQILQPEEIKAFSPHIHYGDMASQIVQQASVYIE
ncbi:MAG: hypothetical protein ABI210_12020, partial [Abditibacteriaceae bacterium]